MNDFCQSDLPSFLIAGPVVIYFLLKYWSNIKGGVKDGAEKKAVPILAYGFLALGIAMGFFNKFYC